jgi:hypothetical protein
MLALVCSLLNYSIFISICYLVIQQISILDVFKRAYLESGFYSADRTHYYEARNQKLNYHEADKLSHNLIFKCRTGHVVTITSQEENDNIASNLWSGSYNLWIAANNILTAGNTPSDSRAYYVWGDGPENGQEVAWAPAASGDESGSGDTYGAWAAGQPSAVAAGVAQDCVTINGGQWYSSQCDDSSNVGTLVEYECPSGYYFGVECCEGTYQ